ncbi:MAG: hypothetical protein PsegKO_29510 [Pseudohongiellaceae bacterium]|jgi:hypothetical protein
MVRCTLTLSLLAVTFGSATSLAQTTDAADMHQELENTRRLVNSLESHTDHHDPQLAEPLLQLGDDLMQAGEFAEAHQTLDRGMQIVRINEGLYTRSQLPYLRKKIENFTFWNDWESARSQLQHLFWLYRTKSRVIDRVLIDDLQDLSAMHLRGVTEDLGEYQSYHLRRAVSANWMALAAGEALWGKTDERLAPVIYNLVKHYHLQAAAVENGGRTAYELRQIAPGSDWVRERADARRFFYYTGLRLLRQLRGIYVDAEPANPEGLAMSDLYLADWHAMFSRNGEAVSGYKQAYQGLQSAGIDSALIEAFFSQPSLLPESDFHDTLAEATAARSAEQQQPRLLASSAAAETLYFNEWSAAFPYVRRPSQVNNQQPLDSSIALFSFNIAGVTDITHWINGRKETDLASIREPTIVQPTVESEDQQEQLLRRLEYLRFRPRLDNGEPREAAATLMYQIASD